MSVGHDLKSCTKIASYVICPHPKSPDSMHRIVLVDTPGFNDTYAEDSEILARIITWMKLS